MAKKKRTQIPKKNLSNMKACAIQTNDVTMLPLTIGKQRTSKSSSGPKHKQIELQDLFNGLVFVAENFLLQHECVKIIEWAEGCGFEYVQHDATRYIAQRECGRLQRDCVTTASKLWERIEPMIALVAGDLGVPKGRHAVGCNPNIRLYRYERGHAFGKHVDESNSTTTGRTELTMLVYLNGANDDDTYPLNGGETAFYAPHDQRHEVCRFAPRAGSVLIHVHGDRCLPHEALKVNEGCKYILRTDIVYSQ
eukprot:m.117759 g.117759  ORF g.117759 m.117759 type:complete len:251 (-) comp28604_c0_seq1:57-809(-)